MTQAHPYYITPADAETMEWVTLVYNGFPAVCVSIGDAGMAGRLSLAKGMMWGKDT